MRENSREITLKTSILADLNLNYGFSFHFFSFLPFCFSCSSILKSYYLLWSLVLHSLITSVGPEYSLSGQASRAFIITLRTWRSLASLISSCFDAGYFLVWKTSIALWKPSNSLTTSSELEYSRFGMFSRVSIVSPLIFCLLASSIICFLFAGYFTFPKMLWTSVILACITFLPHVWSFFWSPLLASGGVLLLC